MSDQIALLCQEQQAQTESLGEIRLALDALHRLVKRLESQLDDQAARIEDLHERLTRQEARSTGSIQGLDGEVTVSFPPEWGEVVPLVEVSDSDG